MNLFALFFLGWTLPLLGDGQARCDVHGDPLPPGAVARIGTVRFRHGGELRSLAFSPDSRFLATSAADRTISIWDLATGRLVFQKPLQRLQGQGMLTTTNRSEPLQWFPDSQGWLLFQKYVVDRRSAAIVQTLDTPGEANYTTFGTKIMDDRRVIVADIHNKFRVVEVQRTPANK